MTDNGTLRSALWWTSVLSNQTYSLSHPMGLLHLLTFFTNKKSARLKMFYVRSQLCMVSCQEQYAEWGGCVLISRYPLVHAQIARNLDSQSVCKDVAKHNNATRLRICIRCDNMIVWMGIHAAFVLPYSTYFAAEYGAQQWVGTILLNKHCVRVWWTRIYIGDTPVVTFKNLYALTRTHRHLPIGLWCARVLGITFGPCGYMLVRAKT